MPTPKGDFESQPQDSQSAPLAKRVRVMSIKEVSDFLKIPLSSVYELAHKGILKGVKIGKHWRFLEEEIVQHLVGEGFVSKPDRRKEARIHSEVPILIKILRPAGNSEQIQANIVNMSPGGLQAVFQISPGTDLLHAGDPIEILLPLKEGAAARLARGRVVHAAKNGTVRTGIQFWNLNEKVREVFERYAA